MPQDPVIEKQEVLPGANCGDHDQVETYGHQFPAYRDDPLAETLRAVEGIAADVGFAAGYATFGRDMVYGEASDFEMAIATLKSLAELLKSEQA
jgi:hypothetical protein